MPSARLSRQNFFRALRFASSNRLAVLSGSFTGGASALPGPLLGSAFGPESVVATPESDAVTVSRGWNKSGAASAAGPVWLARTCSFRANKVAMDGLEDTSTTRRRSPTAFSIPAQARASSSRSN